MPNQLSAMQSVQFSPMDQSDCLMRYRYTHYFKKNDMKTFVLLMKK
jgi:hypothetical protein